MTPDDLESAIARTGHERYRYLVSDANPDVVSREGYRRVVREIASGEAPRPLVPLAESINAHRLGFQQCWFSTKDDACGCSGVRCHLLGRIVGLVDCVECLKKR